MEKEEREKHIYRLPPCPYYDIEGMESWLESMALEGYILCEDGFFAGFVTFMKGLPSRIRYRLEAAPRGTGIWSDKGDRPDNELILISKECGWEFVSSCRDFYVFSSQDAEAREMSTDSEVQALEINLLRKRVQNSFLLMLVMIVYYFLNLTEGNVFTSIIDIGTGLYLLGFFLLAWVFCNNLAKILHLRRLKRQLAIGEVLSHKKNWRRRAGYYKAGKVLFLVLIFIWVISYLEGCNKDIMEDDKIRLNSYSGMIPFSTMESLVPNGKFKLEENLGFSNTIRVRKDWLAPRVISLSQYGTLQIDEKNRINGGLKVDYYETISPWLAKQLAKEYQDNDRKKKKELYKIMDTPDVDVDYIAAYSTFYPTLIIADGNRMIHLEFSQFSENSKNMDEWLEIFAQKFVR